MDKVAVICGSSQGIGLAIVKELLLDKSFNLVIASHRAKSDLTELSLLKKSFPKKLMLFELDATSQDSVESMVQKIDLLTNSINLFINCIGFLHNKRVVPEKSIDEISPESFFESIKINTLPTLLLAKSFRELLQNTKDSVFISLSAKIGSIEDNKIGGWYSYRSSKAALNMCIKNISIEFNRLGKECTVFAIHPGTTETQLSAPFLNNARKKYVIHTTQETALNILDIALHTKNQTHNGRFFSWDGEEIPW